MRGSITKYFLTYTLGKMPGGFADIAGIKARTQKHVQWNPAITKCHGTEKSVRDSGLFVTAKTPL